MDVINSLNNHERTGRFINYLTMGLIEFINAKTINFGYNVIYVAQLIHKILRFCHENIL